MRFRHLVVLTALALALTSCAKKNVAEPVPPPAAEVAAPVVKEPPTAIDIQRALLQNGAKLKADGKMGPRTTQALKKFQAKNGLKPTGVADEATLEKLGL